jgi:cytochrome c-type biogenesis protein
VIFFVVGLHLFGLFTIPWSGPGQVGMARKGMLAAFLLGLLFGIALGPCTFAFLAPMLGVTFSLGADRMLFGAALLLAYGIGHCAIIVLAGTFTEVIQKYLNWTERSKGALLLKKVCGMLVMFGGVWMLYTAR